MMNSKLIGFFHADSEHRNSAGSSDVESQDPMLGVSEKVAVLESAPASRNRVPFKVDARVISDAIIGLADGLTVPFALTAGLSALGDTKVVVYGGLAELIAGAISMGLGGYLGAKSEGYVVFPTSNCSRSHH